jgi:hypothetical protein
MEHRRYKRVKHPFTGIWRGASRDGECRISDLSAGGCYVQTMAMPAIGESTVISIDVFGHQFTFTGRIVYVERGMGFAIEFTDMPDSEREHLNQLLETLPGT